MPDDLYYSVRPMLAVAGGRLIALSTPFGRHGWFSDAGSPDRGNVSRSRRTSAHGSPRNSSKRNGATGRWWYRQEYECEFLEAEDSVFSFDDITAALSPNVTPLWKVA